MTFTTQMDAAKKGITTPQMEIVAKQEHMDLSLLQERIARGTIVIPANKMHHALVPAGIGEGLSTKINVNLGMSKSASSFEQEQEKAATATALGAHAIMDLSNCGKTAPFRKHLVVHSPAMLGTVPVYDAIGYHNRPLNQLTAADFLEVVRKHAEDGVDFMTIHAGLTRKTAEQVKKAGRLTNVVSRGGALLFAWMEITGHENPFYEHYDQVLEILSEYDVTISLGDACRPGSIEDSTDACQVQELIELGELTKRAWDRHVQVIVEGPGHMALGEVAANMIMQKKLCHGAPFYVLGPLVTDIAPGYDHITSAIGGAIAAANGADFLCYVTPAEHLRLPDLQDMKDGIMASRIAAHAADIAKGIPGARQWDYEMSTARQRLDWQEMFRLAIDPDKAKAYRDSAPPEEEDTCSMCGNMCAMRNMNRILGGEEIGI